MGFGRNKVFSEEFKSEKSSGQPQSRGRAYRPRKAKDGERRMIHTTKAKGAGA